MADSPFNMPTKCSNEYSMYDGFLRCSYCGSIQVRDAIKILKSAGNNFSGSDWKYGWPHKFYFDVINPEADKLVEIGSSSGRGVTKDTPGAVWVGDGKNEDGSPRGYYKVPTMGKRPMLHVKFYTSHLNDCSQQDFDEFNELSQKFFKIKWNKDIEKGLGYYCVPGIQMSGTIDKEGNPVFNDWCR